MQDTATSGVTLLAYFASCEYAFRIPELEAIADTLNIPISIPFVTDMTSTPFVKVVLPSHDAARQIATRCVTLKGFYEVWGEGNDYAETKEDVKRFIAVEKELHKRCASESFKIQVEAYGRKLNTQYQKEARDGFIFLDFEGDVVMENPQNTFHIFEDVGEHKPNVQPPRRVYFVREVYNFFFPS
eukprot:TRINITY_DN571_c0_g1_i1.p1 TRINITY_DN571_c0_g1~~TRINITY_DN571_c0_g1_i1.p1  ORF type:complete len:185 (-),score=40.18 TRINITY_DN571_c0_g1_i1:34-588(-)